MQHGAIPEGRVQLAFCGKACGHTHSLPLRLKGKRLHRPYSGPKPNLFALPGRGLECPSVRDHSHVSVGTGSAGA